MKAIVGMVCVTALAGINMIINGDGSTLAAAIAAISGLAGVSIGVEVAQKVTKE